MSEALDRIRAEIYAAVPNCDCKGLCANACGIITLQEVERDALIRNVGSMPPQRADGMCPFLTQDGKCSAYEDRPLICRLYGVAETMKCEYGCQPERWLTDADCKALMLRIAEIAGGNEELRALQDYLDLDFQQAKQLADGPEDLAIRIQCCINELTIGDFFVLAGCTDGRMREVNLNSDQRAEVRRLVREIQGGSIKLCAQAVEVKLADAISR